MKLQELLENTIKLTDLYDEDELNDSTEQLSQYIDEHDYDKDYVIRVMSPEAAKTYLTPMNDMTVYESFINFATKEQKKVVKEKSKHYDNNRIIVVMNKTVVDGNHHLIAGILANKSIKYIDVGEY